MVMFNLFDILQSQSGGMQGLGQQFGLSPDQSRRAMEALLPALTIGLQRNAATDPAGLGRMFGLMGAGPYSGARPPAQPDMLLGQLFGSPALSQAVLQQAAAASGIGQQALRQMLPVMAGMVVAGIVHAMLNQPPPPPPAREPEPQPPPAFPAAEFWNDWMNSFLSSANRGTSESDARPPTRIAKSADTERERAVRPSVAPPRPAPEIAPPPEPKAEAAPNAPKAPDDASDASLEVFQQMFQTGVQVQEQNVKAMQDIFDSFWSAPSAAPEAAEAAPTSPSAADAPAKAKRVAKKAAPAKPRGGKSR